MLGVPRTHEYRCEARTQRRRLHPVPGSLARHLGQEIPPDRQGRHAHRQVDGRHLQARRPSAGGRGTRGSARASGTRNSCGRCARARFPPAASPPMPARWSTSPPRRPSTARSPAPSATRWTTSSRKSTRRASRSRRVAASAMNFRRCGRAARTCPAPAPIPRARCPSWISSTRCASRCPPPAVAAARRWARSMLAIPDAMDFIRAKRESGRLRQFNLSLLITDEFMQAVRENRDWKLAFPLSLEGVRDGEAGSHRREQVRLARVGDPRRLRRPTTKAWSPAASTRRCRRAACGT